MRRGPRRAAGRRSNAEGSPFRARGGPVDAVRNLLVRRAAQETDGNIAVVLAVPCRHRLEVITASR